jgi:hypothetical protein
LYASGRTNAIETSSLLFDISFLKNINEVELEAVISQAKPEEETPGGRIDLEEFLQRGIPLIRTAIEVDEDENHVNNNTHKIELNTSTTEFNYQKVCPIYSHIHRLIYSLYLSSGSLYFNNHQ